MAGAGKRRAQAQLSRDNEEDVIDQHSSDDAGGARREGRARLKARRRHEFPQTEVKQGLFRNLDFKGPAPLSSGGLGFEPPAPLSFAAPSVKEHTRDEKMAGLNRSFRSAIESVLGKNETTDLSVLFSQYARYKEEIEGRAPAFPPDSSYRPMDIPTMNITTGNKTDTDTKGGLAEPGDHPAAGQPSEPAGDGAKDEATGRVVLEKRVRLFVRKHNRFESLAIGQVEVVEGAAGTGIRFKKEDTDEVLVELPLNRAIFRSTEGTKEVAFVEIGSKELYKLKTGTLEDADEIRGACSITPIPK